MVVKRWEHVSENEQVWAVHYLLRDYAGSQEVKVLLCPLFSDLRKDIAALTLQRGVTGTARMLHALTHSSISRQVREQM